MLSGILPVDKPADYTSFDVVAVLRRLSGERRIGHTGTLDPMATGALPVLFGKCTRLLPLLPTEDKAYLASFRLGVTTDTEDSTGTVLKEKPVAASESDVAAVLRTMVGPQLQLPPMYSAVKKDGVRLYKLAREGKEVEREPREVTIHSIHLVSCREESGEYTMEVRCSKGTYIRSLCRDIGERLSCGAVMTGLRRTMACGFSLSDCRTLDELRAMSREELLNAILSPERTLLGYPEVAVSAAQASRFQNGGGLSFERLPLEEPSGLYRVYAPGRVLLGLGNADAETGELKVKCHL